MTRSAITTLTPVLLALMACGQPETGLDSTKTDPLLLPYYESFQARHMRSGRHIDEIKFSALDFPILGLTEVWDTGYVEIRIDPGFWLTADSSRRQVVVWHELGHGVLARDHNNDWIGGDTDRHHASIMNYYVLPLAEFITWRNYYEIELFATFNP